MIYLGLPQWQHSGWRQYGMTTLADYAQWFNCVEGNTTLYALPPPERVADWRAMTPDSFRFCFKFPATISHQGGLREVGSELALFFATLSPLADRIGQYWLQLPAAFAPADLPALWRFLDLLPADFHYGVEVRHSDFFAKGDAERSLNQGLRQRNVNRVMLDSRPVHLAGSGSAAQNIARAQKPRLPVHVLTTADRPMIRFIGADDADDNLALFQPWLERLPLWQERHTPFLFLHTPDITWAPALAQRLWPLLAARIEGIGPVPTWPHQETLF